jgi:hypothetical protein
MKQRPRQEELNAEAGLTHDGFRSRTLATGVPRGSRRNASGRVGQIWVMPPSATSSMPVT